MYKYDASRIGKARRKAIGVLDEYGCTTEELRAMFDVSKATFHRYADGVRLRRRPTEVFVPMVPADALEIATIGLLRAGFAVAEIVAALHTSKSSVYRQRKAWMARLGDLSPAEQRMRRRHIPTSPNHADLRPEERRLEAQRRLRRWVTRSRGRVSY